LYCFKACQKQDWEKQHGHKKLCKLLNVGHGDMQVWTPVHTHMCIASKEQFEAHVRSLDEDDKRFFKLFEESTLEGSQATARKMKKYDKEHTKYNQDFLLFHSVRFLAGFCDLEMLSWPNSPLLVMLQFVDPNYLAGNDDIPLQEGKTRITLLYQMSSLADPCDYSTHENQRILAKQLIEHGANVNAETRWTATPLHNACYWTYVTNLDYVEFLLKKMPIQMLKTIWE
jgi:hypothetical protein